ncbi:MAG: tRNA (cytidine(56)-2'-O)-methyltransferase [Candidatus Bathyarchaeota archaeon]|nr:tRNA (cytidine(56)-2'-O)-methyltransferase [Candidatus Bathyarchaeota archaeon]
MKRWRVCVLRLNHRLNRDKRVTTHLLLAARAFGADEAFYSGQRDEKIEGSVEKVNESWGGSFEVKYAESWRKAVRGWKKAGGEVVHLTMYGLPLQDVIERIKESPKDKLIVVGGAKVPGVVYELVDWNVSVTSQPHSEISALSVFLHELFGGGELSRTFEKAEMRILPQRKGKKVVRTEL